MKKITQYLGLICAIFAFTYTAKAQNTSGQLKNKPIVSSEMQTQIQEALQQQAKANSKTPNRGALEATYIGSFYVGDGPGWSTNPPVYSGVEAAALIFGGDPSDYAISTDPNTTDPSTITHTAWASSWGVECLEVAEDYSYDLDPPGYTDPGIENAAVSAYVSDWCFEGQANYVWRVPSLHGNALALTPGNKVSFDGSSSPNLVNNFSIEAWIYIDASCNNISPIVARKISGPGNSGFAFFVNKWMTNDRRLVFESLGEDTYTLNPVIPDNVWTHVAVTVSSANVPVIYVNGVSVPLGASKVEINPASSSIAMYIGCLSDGYYNNYSGKIDELSIWDRVLTPAEINSSRFAPVIGTEGDLLAYYNFNEGVADQPNPGITNLPDKKQGGSNNGTLINFTLDGSTSNWVKSDIITPCNSPSTGGEIAGTQTICYNTAPTAFTSTSLPTGHDGILEYKWQSSTTSASSGFSDIAASNAATYTAGLVTTTTWYKRLARVECMSDWTGAAESNVLVVSLNPLPTPAIYAAGATTFCNGDMVALSAGGNALEFGSNSRVEIDDNPSLRFSSSQSYTLTAWIYVPNNTGTWRGVISKSRDLPFLNSSNYGIYIDTENKWISGGAGNNITGGAATPGWHHVAIVQQGSVNRQIFVDGVLGGTGLVVNSNGTGKLRIGQSYDNFEEFEGGIVDECALFNTNLNQATIQSWMNESFTSSHPNYANIVGYWKLDEGTGSLTTADASGNGHTGTLVNSPVWVATTAPVNEYASYLWSPGGITTPINNVNTSGIYTVTVTDANGCSNTSAGISITARDPFTPGEISAIGQAVCYGDTPSEIGSTTAASGGDELITYSWRSSADSYTSAIVGATSETFTPPADLTNTTGYRRYAHDATCNTAFEVSTGTWTVTLRDNFTPGAILTTGEVICYGGTPAVEIGNTTIASGGDGTITYSWRSSVDGYTAAIVGASSENYTPPAGLITTTSYQRYANDGTCSTTPEVSTGTWTVTVQDQFTAGSITADQTICNNSIPATLIGVAPTGGNMPYIYQWQSSEDNVTFTDVASATDLNYSPGALIKTTYYKLVQTSASGCGSVSTNTVTITVYPDLEVGSITGDQTICYNTTPDPLTGVAPTGGNPNYTYQWQQSTDNVNFTDISDATNLDYSPPALIQSTYYRLNQTSGYSSSSIYFDDGSAENTTAMGINSLAWLGNYYPVAATFSGKIKSVDLYFEGASSPGLSVDIFDDNLILIGSSNVFTTPTNTWATVPINDILITGPFYVMVKWNALTYSTNEMGLDTDGPHASDGLAFLFDQFGNPVPLSSYGLNGVFLLRATIESPGGINTSNSSCGTLATNTVTINVYNEYTTGAIATTGETICYGGDPAEIVSLTDAGGGDEIITYQWQSSTDAEFTTPITIASNTATYDPPSGLTVTTWYRRQAVDATCNTIFTSSTGVWRVDVEPVSIAGSLAKVPDVLAVCENTNVSAILTPGNGGNGIDEIEFRTNSGSWSGWLTYISGSNITTTGLNTVEIRTRRLANLCVASDFVTVSWSVETMPTVGSLTKIPDVINVCENDNVSAIFTPGNGGNGIDELEFRTNDGIWSAWAAYTSGDDISTADLSGVEVRTRRTSSYCENTVYTTVSWSVETTPIAGLLTKTPDVMDVCENDDVSATLTAGSGGNGTDELEFRTNDGIWSAWAAYTSGTDISTVDLSGVEIRTRRVSSTCLPSAYTTVEWSVEATPIAGLLAKTPDVMDVCENDNVSAIFTPGNGGNGIDELEFRTNDGIWSAWAVYTSGTDISTAALSGVEIRTRRAASTCLPSAYTTVEWSVEATPIAGLLTKTPDLMDVCENDIVSAILTIGNGGNGIDELEFRTNDGSWSAWEAYTSGTDISTADLSDVEIRTRRTASTCSSSAYTTVGWTVEATPIAGSLAKTPVVMDVCENDIVSAILTIGNGGNGIDELEFRTNDGSWSAWAVYTSGTDISTAALSGVEIRTRRAASTCLPSAYTTVEWSVESTPIAGLLSKTPDVVDVCENDNVSATLISGTGGNGIDELEFRTNDGVWSAWEAYTSASDISSAGLSGIEIRTRRLGTLCNTSDFVTVGWGVAPTPIAGSLARIPDEDTVCEGEPVSALLTPGANGNGLDEIEYRTQTGINWSIWVSYTPGDQIATNGRTGVEIRTRRLSSLCNSTSYTTVSWNIESHAVAGSILKTPDNNNVCEGEFISAQLMPGTGGDGTDDLDFRTNNGITWTAWSVYTQGTNISTTGIHGVEMRTRRNAFYCDNSTYSNVSWLIEQTPVNGILVKNPDAIGACITGVVSATLVPGEGGNGIDEMQYRSSVGSSWSAWKPYTSGSNIAASGKSGIEIRTRRTATYCSAPAYSVISWSVELTPIAGSLAKTPDVMNVCENDIVSAILTPGIDGNGIDELEFRTNDGTWSAWALYTSGTDISTTDLSDVEIRTRRTSFYCENSAYTTVSWIVEATSIAGSLAKTPDVLDVCENDIVSAILISGNGGNGIDELEFRTNDGTWSAWAAYTSGADISTTNLSGVEIRTRRAASTCLPSAYTTVEWSVEATPIAGLLTKTPDVMDVCENDIVSAILTIGNGGNGIDELEFRTNNGSWSAWAAYTSGTDISTADLSGVEIRTRRAASTCSSSAYTTVEWNVEATPIAGLLTKTPDVLDVCENDIVSAILTIGNGGNGIDELEFRTNNGSWSAWAAYTSGVDISTADLSGVEIRTRRAASTCLPSAYTTVEWSVEATPIAGLLTKTPDVMDVCENDIVSAILTIGNGGNGIDELEFRTNDGIWSAWAAYTSGTDISTADLSGVEIRTRRAASTCSSSAYTTVEWSVEATPIAGSLTKTPDVMDVCENEIVSAILTSGNGGNGIDELEFRTNDGIWSTWAAYTSGVDISTTNLSGVEIRTRRAASTCLPSAYTTVEWSVEATPIAGLLTKTPDVMDVCENDIVSAILTIGNGGNGIDELEFRTNDGIWSTWAAYTSGADISTADLSGVEIRTRRVASTCSSSAYTTVSWNVEATPIAGSLTKTPDVMDVCENEIVSAILTIGNGGNGIDELEFRTNDGSWSTWAAYTSGADISTADLSGVEIRTRRAASTCLPSAYTTVEWSVEATPIAGLLTKTPDVMDVCENDLVSAILTIGNGGNGIDELEFRINDGTWSTWAAYTSGADISTTNLSGVEIRTRRAASTCLPSAYTTVEWSVEATPIAGLLTKTPDVMDVCENDMVSAILTIGNGGNGIDELEFRTNDGSWSAWASYTSGTDISTADLSGVEIRTRRAASTCLSSAYTTVEWSVEATPIAGLLTKTPDVMDVCENDIVSAILTIGNGGNGIDELEFRTNDGIWSTWAAYTSGADISTADLSGVEIRTRRAASTCSSSAYTTVEWSVEATPIAGLLTKTPDVMDVCENDLVSAILTIGNGGNGIDELEFRTNDGSWSAWAAYTSGADISTADLSGVEIRTRRAASTCSSSAYTTVEWSVEATPIAGLLTKTPDVMDVCENDMVSAILIPGNGGNGIDELEFRTNDGIWSVWAAYTSGTDISTADLSGVEIRTRRAASTCLPSAYTTVEWSVEATPITGLLTKTPDVMDVCENDRVSAILTIGNGGNGIDELEFRTNDGTWSVWAAYTSGANISTADLSGVEIRTRRAATTCSSSAYTTISWSVEPTPIAGSLTKTPDVMNVCETGIVSAILTAGNGGNGIDELEFRTNDGTWSAWAAYTSGTDISTVNLSGVEIRTRRTSTYCENSAYVTVGWTTEAIATAGSLAKTPDVMNVCENDIVSAILTTGSGGNGIDELEFRTNDGVWSVWAAYTSGANIPTADLSGVEIRTRRTSTYCENSAYITVGWTIEPTPIAGSLTKTPDVMNVCETGIVSAILTAGNGGNGIDELEFRINDGTWSAWAVYTSGADISTVDLSGVEIRTRRTASYCESTAYVTVGWTTEAIATAGSFTKIPDVMKVCENDNVSAILIPGSGGNGIDELEFRTKAGTWTDWAAYTSGAEISTADLSEVEIRTRRISAYCENSAYTTVGWVIEATPIAGLLIKTPDVMNVCENDNVSAILTSGNGGNGLDVLQFRTNNGTWSSWAAYTSGVNISTADLSGVEIRTRRAATTCSYSAYTTVSWNVEATPNAGLLSKTPDVVNVCENDIVSAVFTSGNGGNGIDELEFRINNGIWSAWAAYTSGTNISTTALSGIEIRTRRTSTYCENSAYTTVGWIVEGTPVVGSLVKVPDVINVCENDNVSAILTAGIGGNGIDELEFRTNNGTWSAWTAYTSGAEISTADVSGVEIRTRRTSTYCESTAYATVGWNVEATPIAGSLVKTPDVMSVCENDLVSAIFTSGSGGNGVDELLFRTNNGTWSTWAVYTSGTEISTANLSGVEIRTRRTSSYCENSAYLTVGWNVEATAVAGLLTKTPDVMNVCENDVVSAILTSGEGGNGIDQLEFRTKAGTWSDWAAYTSGANISTANISGVEIRTRRNSSYCENSGYNVVSWNVTPQAVAGVVVGPQSVCYGTNSSVLHATGYTGSIVMWQSSTNNWTTTTNIQHTLPTLLVENLTVTTKFRTVVQSGNCGQLYSAAAEIKVNPLPAPFINGAGSICDLDEIYEYATEPNMVSYEWSVSSGQIISGQGSNLVTVQWSGSGTQLISVDYQTVFGCTMSEPFSFTVELIKPETPVITLSGFTLTSSAPAGNQWFLNGTIIEGATSQTYVAIENGDYTCIVTLNGCPSAVSNTITILNVGTHPSLSFSMDVYPVPNKGLFTVKLLSPGSSNYTLTVYNVLGSVVYSKESIVVSASYSQTINLTNSPTGIYTVVMQNENTRFIRKIVIQNN